MAESPIETATEPPHGESQQAGVTDIQMTETPIKAATEPPHGDSQQNGVRDAKMAESPIEAATEPPRGESQQNWVELFRRLADAARVFKDISQTYKFSVAGMITVVAALFSVLYPSAESESPATVNLTSWTRTRTLSQAEKYPSSLPVVLAQGEKQLGNYDFGVRMDVQVQDCSSDVRWKKTFPDLDYSLLGYDIIYGNPLANGRDPGLRHQIFSADFSKPTQSSDCRYVIPAGLFAVSSESCDVSFESKLVRNKQEMKNHLGAQAKIEGGGWGFEFSASASYQRDSSEMSKGEFLYVISHAECHNYYSTIDIMNPPPFHPGFLAWTKKLSNSNVSDEEFLKFVEYFGSHFFTEVTFGAKFIQKHKVSQSAYEKLKKSKISVEAQASYSGIFSIGGGFSFDKEQSEAASNFSKNVETTTFTLGSTPPSNGDAMTWASSVQQNPVPMLYSLSQIDTLFTGQFASGFPPEVNVERVRKKLQNISRQYCQALQKKGTVHSCEPKVHLEASGIDITGKGYRYLTKVEKAVCVSFCLQDPDCTAITYTILHQSQASSLCKFYSAVGKNGSVHLNLTKKDDSEKTSNLVLFISKVQDVHLYHATLEGSTYHMESQTTFGHCNSTCANDLFCDVFSFSYNGICSLYSASEISNIVVDDASEVSFIALHSFEN